MDVFLFLFATSLGAQPSWMGHPAPAGPGDLVITNLPDQDPVGGRAGNEGTIRGEGEGDDGVFHGHGVLGPVVRAPHVPEEDGTVVSAGG